MASNNDTKPGNGESLERIAFDYIKSQNFRVIRADGAIGSVTPNGHIHFALYSERPAIPRRLVHGVVAGGQLGPAIDEMTESRHSVVRELDVDVFVNLDTAVALRDWLELKINELTNRLSASSQTTRN